MVRHQCRDRAQTGADVTRGRSGGRPAAPAQTPGAAAAEGGRAAPVRPRPQVSQWREQQQGRGEQGSGTATENYIVCVCVCVCVRVCVSACRRVVSVSG